MINTTNIRISDSFISEETNKIYLHLYVPQLIAYVSIILDRHEDIPKAIERYKDITEIKNYLNQPLLNQ